MKQIVHRARRSGIGWLGWVPVATPVGFLLYARHEWLGSWAGTATWMGGALYVSGPLMAGVTAFVVYLQQRAFGASFGGVAPAARARGAVATPLIVIAAGGHLLVGLAAFAVTAGINHHFDLSILALPAQALVLAGHVAFGYAVAALVRQWWAAPISAVAVFMAPIAGFSGVVPAAWFQFGGEPVVPLGARANVELAGLQALTAVGVALACLASTWLGRRWRGSLSAAACVLAGAACVAVGLPGMNRVSDAPFIDLQETARCDWLGGRLCLLPSNAFAAGEIEAVIQRADAAFLDAEVPGASDLKYQQLGDLAGGTLPQTESIRYFYLPSPLPGAPGTVATEVAQYLVVPPTCWWLEFGDSIPEFAEAQAVTYQAVAWLSLTLGGEDTTGYGAEIKGLSEAQRTAFAHQALAALATCQTDNLPASISQP
ncbi:MAG: hypothetical protein LBR19_06835 [Bifidobacteriaceae bacterium]|jgi:hypothetical protein|nr:hypothetical protein [Bifidobacteriaceae bacterium]